MKHTPVKLAIIGGGAAGMFAACMAAERRVPAVLIERKARLGSKVLMTANGRCNFTKDITPEQFLDDIKCPRGTAEGEAIAKFLAPSIRAFPPRKIISFFRSLNVPVRRLSDFRMFPADGKAATIVHAFGDLLRKTETPIITNCPVDAVQAVRDGFIVSTKNFTICAENVLLATGGVSYPKLGSVGDGQKFAHSLGHHIVPYRAGLIGLETSDINVTRRAGRRYEDARAKVFSSDGRLLYEYRGEVDCESFGLSGAAIYNSQRFIEHSQLKEFTIEVWLEKQRLRFSNLKSRPVKEAIVTIGGVATDEIDPATMQSRKVPGLYFAGEVMDIDGPTGGYNLSMAFATAAKAVFSISRA